MSAAEQRQLEELEQRIQARIGRWALAILGTTVLLAVGAASNWYGALGRISAIETWKTERTKPIEDYYNYQSKLEGRLSRIEENQANFSNQITDLKTSNAEILRLIRERR